MARFTPTERRTLTLGTALLALATGARLLLAPGPAEFAWSPAPTGRPAESLDAAIRAVGDTLERQAEAERPLAPGERIDVNRADAVQLQRLPGVGPARAAAILREREAGGVFASPGDLTRVSGIGPAMAARWSDAVAFGGSTGGGRPRRPAPERLDLNRAHPKELEQITGIGPSLARRIIEERARRGGFTSVDDLLDVPGIGPKTLEIVRERAFVR